MEYVKLTKANDWGRDFYRKPRFAGASQADERAQGIRWKEGDLVSVRFPDGHETMCRLSSRRSRLVGDMGRTSEVRSEVPGLQVAYHDVLLWLDLDAVEVDREWADRD